MAVSIVIVPSVSGIVPVQEEILVLEGIRQTVAVRIGEHGQIGIGLDVEGAWEEGGIGDSHSDVGASEHRRRLNVGDGERKGSGIKSVSIAANAVEAIIGAVFSDGGWLEARRVVLQAWEPMLRTMGKADLRDAKSRLQELTQSEGWGLPVYQVTDLGVEKKPRFQAPCYVNEKQMGLGTGERKKTAEINAAEQALERLKSEAGKGI